MTDNQLKALVIDDSPTDSQTLAYLLSKRLPAQAEVANDGLEGLDKLSSTSFDLVFLDVQMPEMNGFDFLCYVRGNPDYKDIPLMMVTSETKMSQMAKALEAGANEYVMKPFTKEVITDKLALLGVLV